MNVSYTIDKTDCVLLVRIYAYHSITAHLDLERRLWERGDGDLWALRFDLLDSYRSLEWLLFLFLSSLLLPDVLDLVVTGDTCVGATGALLAGSESLCSPNSVMNSTWPSGSELEEGELDRLLITKIHFLYTGSIVSNTKHIIIWSSMEAYVNNASACTFTSTYLSQSTLIGSRGCTAIRY